MKFIAQKNPFWASFCCLTFRLIVLRLFQVDSLLKFRKFATCKTVDGETRYEQTRRCAFSM